jgi:hypothetical protein
MKTSPVTKLAVKQLRGGVKSGVRAGCDAGSKDAAKL